MSCDGQKTLRYREEQKQKGWMVSLTHQEKALVHQLKLDILSMIDISGKLDDEWANVRKPELQTQ